MNLNPQIVDVVMLLSHVRPCCLLRLRSRPVVSSISLSSRIPIPTWFHLLRRNRVLLYLNLASRSFYSLDIYEWWCLEHILVTRHVEGLLLIQHWLNFFTNVVVDITYQVLLMFVFLNLLFHVAETIINNLSIQFKLQFLPFDSFFLLLDLNWKEVHHVIVLLDLLQSLLLLVFEASNFIEVVIKLIKFNTKLCLIRCGFFLQLIDLSLFFAELRLGRYIQFTYLFFDGLLKLLSFLNILL